MARAVNKLALSRFCRAFQMLYSTGAIPIAGHRVRDRQAGSLVAGDELLEGGRVGIVPTELRQFGVRRPTAAVADVR